MRDLNATEKHASVVELRMRLKSPHADLRDIVIVDDATKKLQKRFSFNENIKKKSRKNSVFDIKKEKPVSTSFVKSQGSFYKPNQPRINKSINFYNKTNAFEHFIKKNGNFQHIDKIMKAEDNKNKTCYLTDINLQKDADQIIDNIDRHINFHSTKTSIDKTNYKRIKFEKSNSNIDFLRLYQDVTYCKEDDLDKDISRATEVRLSAQQATKNKLRFSKSSNNFFRVEKKDIEESFYNKKIRPEDANKTFGHKLNESNILEKRLSLMTFKSALSRKTSNFSYTKGFLNNIKDPATTKQIDKKSEMNTFIRQRLEHEIDAKTKKLNNILTPHDNAVSHIKTQNQITKRSNTYKVDYKIKNKKMQLKLNQWDLEKCFMKHWKKTIDSKKRLRDIRSFNQAKKLFQDFLDKLEQGNKIHTIIVPEEVLIVNEDFVDYYKPEVAKKSSFNYLRTMTTVVNTLVTNFYEDSIVGPDPFEDLARDFFDPFSQLDDDEIKNLTCWYPHPHNPHHKPKTPERPPTPEPIKQVKKIEVRSYTIEGDKDSIRPSQVIRKFYNIGEEKERYK